VAGGVESISLAQNEHATTSMAQEPWLLEDKPEIFMTMIETANFVARRYGISRGSQDAFALESQSSSAAAQESGPIR
jgi:acetyl-CoA C-acetyltransferase